MATKRTLIHKNSSIANKIPTLDALEHGEIAVNYNSGKEFLTIKNSAGSLTTFDAATNYGTSADGTGTSVNYTSVKIKGSSTPSKNSLINGAYSATLGHELQTSNEGEVAVGKFNTTKQDLLFSVGNGADGARSNVFEATEQGITVSGTVNINEQTLEQYINTVAPKVTVDETLDKTSSNPVANSAITKTIEDNELVLSSALNDLNTRLVDHTSDDEIHHTHTNKDALDTISDAKVAIWDECITGITVNGGSVTSADEGHIARLTVEGGGGGEPNVITGVSVNNSHIEPTDKVVNIMEIPADIVVTTNELQFVSATEKNTWNTVTSKTDNTSFTAHTGNTTIHHTHTNKDVLDTITTSNTANWNSAAANFISGITVNGGSTVAIAGQNHVADITVEGGEANVITGVSINGTHIDPSNKEVNITGIPASIVQTSTTREFVSDTEKGTWDDAADNFISGITLSDDLSDTDFTVTDHAATIGIKTINGQTLRGRGNIVIQGGGTIDVDDALSTTSTNPVQNKVITSAINGINTSITTINGRFGNYLSKSGDIGIGDYTFKNGTFLLGTVDTDGSATGSTRLILSATTANGNANTTLIGGSNSITLGNGYMNRTEIEGGESNDQFGETFVVGTIPFSSTTDQPNSYLYGTLYKSKTRDGNGAIAKGTENITKYVTQEDYATASSAGVVKIGSGLSIDASGELGVKFGSGLSIDTGGTLYIPDKMDITGHSYTTSDSYNACTLTTNRSTAPLRLENTYYSESPDASPMGLDISVNGGCQAGNTHIISGIGISADVWGEDAIGTKIKIGGDRSSGLTIDGSRVEPAIIDGHTARKFSGNTGIRIKLDGTHTTGMSTTIINTPTESTEGSGDTTADDSVAFFTQMNGSGSTGSSMALDGATSVGSKIEFGPSANNSTGSLISALLTPDFHGSIMAIGGSSSTGSSISMAGNNSIGLELTTNNASATGLTITSQNTDSCAMEINGGRVDWNLNDASNQTAEAFSMRVGNNPNNQVMSVSGIGVTFNKGVYADGDEFVISQNGNTVLSAMTGSTPIFYGTVGTTSDERLKDDIFSITTDDIDKVSGIELKSYVLKSDDEKRKKYGIIAQDLEGVGLNHLVHGGENDYKSVDYTSFLILKIAQLEKEIQELKKAIE